MATTATIAPSVQIKANVLHRYILRPIFSLHLMSISALALLAILIAQTLHDPSKMFRDPDIWWHLANARNLFTTHHFVVTEPFSFTVKGQPWLNPEWGAEVPFWFAFQAFHLSGIYLATWLLIVTNLVILYARSLPKVTNAWPALWASVLGLGLMTINAGPRTILFGYLCLSAVLWVIERAENGDTRWIKAIPAVFLVWVNLHGSWIIGLVLLAIYVACGFVRVHHGLIEQERREWKVQKSLLAAFGTSCAAIFVNPYGWRLVWNPFDMMFHQPLNIATIEEWKPLDLSWFVGKVAVVSIALLLTAALLKARKWRLYELAFLCFAWYAAFAHIRFTVLAAVIVVPALAESLGVLLWSEPLKKTHDWLNAIFTAALLIMAIRHIPSDNALCRDLASQYPNRAIQELKPGWRCLNQYELGGRLAFEGKPDFIDSRVDTFEHHGVFLDYIDAIHIKRTFEVLDKYKIDHVLFQEETPLIYLLEHSPAWKVDLRDGDYVLMARK